MSDNEISTFLSTRFKKPDNHQINRINYNNLSYIEELYTFLHAYKYETLTKAYIKLAEFINSKRTKRGSTGSIEYWTSLGHDINSAKLKVSECQKRRSKLCKEYWISKGYSISEATNEISNIQSGISKKWNKNTSKPKSVWNFKYWMSKGYSKHDAKREVLKRNPSSREFYENNLQWLDKRKRISDNMKIVFKNKPEVFKKFLNTISKSEIKFFKYLNKNIDIEINHKSFIVNVSKSSDTDKNIFLYDGYLKFENRIILIEFDGIYWHDEEYDKIKDEIVLKIRSDVIGIIRVSDIVFEKSLTIKKDILNGIKRIKSKESNRIKLY